MKWMTVTCRLPEEVIRELDAKALKAGMSRYLYVGKLVCNAAAPRLLPLMDSPASRRRAHAPKPISEQVEVIRADKITNECQHPTYSQRTFSYGTFCICGTQIQ